MKPSTSSTAIGSLKPASPSSVRSSRLRSPAPRSSEKTAAPSVEEMIAPSSRPSSVEKPNSHEAARPVTTAVISVPGSASPIAGRSTGRISPQPAVSPPSNRISASAITPIVSARWKSSKCDQAEPVGPDRHADAEEQHEPGHPQAPGDQRRGERHGEQGADDQDALAVRQARSISAAAAEWRSVGLA